MRSRFGGSTAGRCVAPSVSHRAGKCTRCAGGVWGWFDDDRAILGDWGFDPSEVSAPLSVWHGAQDRFVPIAHGEWLAEHVRADAHLRPDDGHLSLSLGSYGEILDTLLAFGSTR